MHRQNATPAPLVRVLAEGDRAAVLARRGGRWRALARFTGPDAEARAQALAALLERGLARPAAELLDGAQEAA